MRKREQADDVMSQRSPRSSWGMSRCLCSLYGTSLTNVKPVFGMHTSSRKSVCFAWQRRGSVSQIPDSDPQLQGDVTTRSKDAVRKEGEGGGAVSASLSMSDDPPVWLRENITVAQIVNSFVAIIQLSSKLTEPAWDSTRVTSFLQCVFEYLQKWVTDSADMAGATWNCCCLGAFCVHHATMHHVPSCKAT